MTRRAPAKAPATVGTGVGPSEAPKRRKRAPAQTAGYSWAAHRCVLLAVDPGETSGWAVFLSGSLVASGHGSGMSPRNCAVAMALDLRTDHGLPLVVVAESWPLRWRPAGAPREAWGMWLTAIADVVPKRRIVRVQVGRWSAKILGSCALTTEARRARSVAVARARTGLAITSHDEAAAVCLGLYAVRCPEVGRVLPKRRAPMRCLRCDGTGRIVSLDMSSCDDVTCDACGATGNLPKGRTKR